MSTTLGTRRLPRALHPVAWWLWAIALATAASQTTNPLLLGLIFAVLGLVVTLRRTDAPWARGYRFYLLMALTVIGIRIVFRAVFESGAAQGAPVLFRLTPVADEPPDGACNEQWQFGSVLLDAGA